MIDLSSNIDGHSPAKVKFLTGTQARIDAMQANGGATEGAFYLTSDTHRLFVGGKKSVRYIPITDFNLSAREENFYILINGDFREVSISGTEEGKEYRRYRKSAENETPATYIIQKGIATGDGFSFNNATDVTDQIIGYYELGTQPDTNVYPIPVNAGIQTVNKINDLPATPPISGSEADMVQGDPLFYYIEDSNILCLWGKTSATEYGWIQINSDTYITSIQNTSNPNNGNTTITYIFNTNVDKASSLTLTFKPTTNSAGHISFGGTGTEVTLDVEIASLAVSTSLDAQNTVNINLNKTLGGNDTVGSSVAIHSDGTYVTVAKESNTNQINITGQSQQITGFSANGRNGSVPASLSITQTNGSSSSNNTQNVSLPDIYYGKNNAEGTGQKPFIGLGGTLDVYTIAEVDARIAEVSAGKSSGDAMRFKGLIDDSTYDSIINESISNQLYHQEDNPSWSTSIIFWYQDTNGNMIQIKDKDEFNEKNELSNIWTENKAINGDTYKASALIDSTTILVEVANNEKADTKTYDYYTFANNTYTKATVVDDDTLDTTYLKTRLDENSILVLKDKQYKISTGDLLIAKADGNRWVLAPSGNEVYKILAEQYPQTGVATGATISLKDNATTVYGQINIIDSANDLIQARRGSDSQINLAHKSALRDSSSNDAANNIYYSDQNAGIKYSDSNCSTEKDNYDLISTIPNTKKYLGVLTNVELDDKGHIAGYNISDICQNYIADVTSSVAKNIGVFTLIDSNNKSSSIQLKENSNSSIKITYTANSNALELAADMYWDSF